MGKVRKLSSIIQLTDPKKYSGGELEFCFPNGRPDEKRATRICKEFKPRGSIVIFPSFLEHMVQNINNSVTISGNLKILQSNNKNDN